MSASKSKVPPHPFQRDPDVPADHGRPICRRCGLAYVRGDPRHTLPDAPPEQEWVARRYEGDEER